MSRQFRRSFLALFIPLALTVVLAAVYLFNQSVANQKAILSADGSLDVVSGGRAIERSLDASVQDVLYLASLPELTAMRKITRSGMQELNRAFILFCLTHPAYSKLRLIDEDGREIMRINSMDGNVSVADRRELENKSDRFYFTGSVRLAPGKVYVSPMQLEYENGKVVTPHLPIVRIATPVFDANSRRLGVLVVTVAADDLLARIGIVGCTLYPANSTCVSIGALDASGSSFGVPFAIPNLVGLSGSRVAIQAIDLGPAGADFSNAILGVLGS
jgi:hypothetical protein